MFGAHKKHMSKCRSFFNILPCMSKFIQQQILSLCQLLNPRHLRQTPQLAGDTEGSGSAHGANGQLRFVTLTKLHVSGSALLRLQRLLHVPTTRLQYDSVGLEPNSTSFEYSRLLQGHPTTLQDQVLASNSNYSSRGGLSSNYLAESSVSSSSPSSSATTVGYSMFYSPDAGGSQVEYAGSDFPFSSWSTDSPQFPPSSSS